MQVLQRFVTFLEAEQLNSTLEQVALALWSSAPLSDGSVGDISENTENTDIKLAQSLGIPKLTFDRHKGKPCSLPTTTQREKEARECEASVSPSRRSACGARAKAVA